MLMEAGAQSDLISVTFAFSPAKATYTPGENLTITFTVVNLVADPQKVTNLSAHFGWMGPSISAWRNVSGASSWLAQGGTAAYSLNISIPKNATAQTYSYSFGIGYESNTTWGPIFRPAWGAGTTYHDFVVAYASSNMISVTYAFSPPKAAYTPGENFTITFTVVNLVASPQKVTNLSAHFGWMGPSISAWRNVSGASSWLAQGGTAAYSLNISIPKNATAQTYSYSFGIGYESNTTWGPIFRPAWGAGLTYHDFVVAKASSGNPDIMPYLALLALIVAAILVVAIIVTRRARAIEQRLVAAMGSAPLAQVPTTSQSGRDTYPIIRAAAGERFPVEKGFIYLVKEKRPDMGFAMFNEAVASGAAGMLVAREHPNRLKQMHSFEAGKILWLTRRVGVDHIDPTELSLLNLEITKFVEGTARSVVLLEGIEYVITQNDFEAVLRFVNHMHDFVLAHDCAVIVVIDPRVLSTRELALLERSAKIVEPTSAPEEPERAVEGQTA